MELETRGIPGVGIATTEFVEAADSQSKSLGYEAAILFVPHPIQDRTDDELREIADNAYENIVQRLTSN